MMSEVMCGKDNIINADILKHKCKQFIYFFNHANDHCALQLEKDRDSYKECFWTELAVHLPDRSFCGDVCADAHGHLPKEIDTCHTQCIHVHDCADQCKGDQFKFRDAIMECFSTCMKRSPVSPVGTCQGSCGGHAPNMKCHCDPTCAYTEDCCDDYENFCQTAAMRWNESVPLPNMTFTLPSMNVTKDDIEGYEERHTPAAKNVVEAEVNKEIEERAHHKLYGERDQKKEKSSKDRIAKNRQAALERSDALYR